MNGVPLHPLVVHFPMVLMLLLPISAAFALWAIRRGARPRAAWGVPLAFAAALALSAFGAVRSGGAEEDRVEQVVPERALHEHEEAGERFQLLSAVLLLVVAGGMAGGLVGRGARLVGTAGAVLLIAAGVQVGKAGGELVYVHGAGAAYTSDTPKVDGESAANADSDGR